MLTWWLCCLFTIITVMLAISCHWLTYPFDCLDLPFSRIMFSFDHFFSSSLFCCSNCLQVFLSFYFVVVLSVSYIKTWMKLWHIFSLRKYLFLCIVCRLGFVIAILLSPLHQNNMLLMSSIKTSIKLSHSVNIVHFL